MSNSQFRWLTAGLALATLATLTACGGGGSDSGSVFVGITDAPTDEAQEVWVQVSGVAFKPDGAAPEIVQNFTPRAINLLQYQQGNVAMLLENAPFTAGHYQWLRLIVDSVANVRDSYVMVNGAECEMNVPSGAESGLKMIRGFTIPADGSLALTVDFDLRQSLHAPPGQSSGTLSACTQGYVLRPTLRLVDNANVGAIAGTVSFEAGTVPAACLPKVYVYEGTVTPDDMEDTAAGTDVDPVSVVGVTIPAGASSGTYRAAFVPSGNYTLAFTCSDDTDANETLVFAPPAGTAVTVQNNLISTVDFSVPPES